jgi:hypothetical protein
MSAESNASPFMRVYYTYQRSEVSLKGDRPSISTVKSMNLEMPSDPRRRTSSVTRIYMIACQYCETRGERGHSHVSIVTALLGTVRKRLIDNPLYNPRQPSLVITFLKVPTTPACTFAGVPCRVASASLAISRRWICKRVRMTSCGYVATEAIILDAPEHARIIADDKGASEFPSICELSTCRQHR